jgi:hypothetical protein
VTEGHGSPVARDAAGMRDSREPTGGARGPRVGSRASRIDDTGGSLWWALLVLPWWIVLLLCTHWEPVMRDGWGHILWHRDHRIGLEIYDYFRELYLNENPRLGQLLTMLIYTPGPYHMIVTPLVELGVFAMLTMLALGRWPSIRRSGDALVAAIIAAIIAACVPQIGLMLFYRPFTGNYTFGLALNLLWLVPYRLELAAPRPPRNWLAPVMLVVGLAAGMSNEHTGLAFSGMGLLASVVAGRRGRLRIWMIAGLVGLVAGYALLLTAPGQHVRYSGLLEKAGIIERIADRGVTGNLAVVGSLALALAPALPLVGIAILERRATGPSALSATGRWTCIVLALGGLACTLTVLASPKIGPRHYLASVALIASGLTGWVAAQLRRSWARRGCALLAAASLSYVGVRLVAIHRVVGPPGAIRRDRIEHGKPGSVIAVPRYPVGRSRYFLGDDFADPAFREAIAGLYGLAAIDLEGSDER